MKGGFGWLWYIQAFRKYTCKLQGQGSNIYHLPSIKDSFLSPSAPQPDKQKASLHSPKKKKLLFYSFSLLSFATDLHMSSSTRESLPQHNFLFPLFFLPTLIITKPFFSMLFSPFPSSAANSHTMTHFSTYLLWVLIFNNK